MDFDELDYEKITEILNQRDEEERRARLKKKKDWRSILASVMSLVALCVMVAVWVVLEAAAPEREMRFITSFFDVQFGTAPSVRARWDYALVYIAYVLQLVSLGTCLIALVINFFHVKEKEGKYRISVFIVSGITIIVFVFFMLRFGSIVFQM